LGVGGAACFGAVGVEGEVACKGRRVRGRFDGEEKEEPINEGSGEVPINWTPVSPRNIEW